MTQLLVRYDTWLQEVVKIRQQPPAAAAPVAPAASSPGQQPQLMPGGGQQPGQSVGGSGSSGGVAAPGGAVGGDAAAVARSGLAAWVPDMPLDCAAVICYDADIIKVCYTVTACEVAGIDNEVAGLFANAACQSRQCLRYCCSSVALGLAYMPCASQSHRLHGLAGLCPSTAVTPVVCMYVLCLGCAYALTGVAARAVCSAAAAAACGPAG